jgi:hypothetical protein
MESANSMLVQFPVFINAVAWMFILTRMEGVWEKPNEQKI